MEHLWMRRGLNDEYTEYDDFAVAAEALRAVGLVTLDRWRVHGFESGNLKDENYVSLFWGDEDAALERAMTEYEKHRFVAAFVAEVDRVGDQIS